MSSSESASPIHRRSGPPERLDRRYDTIATQDWEQRRLSVKWGGLHGAFAPGFAGLEWPP